MFNAPDNEISSKIVDFDPADVRTENVDKFLLSTSLGLFDKRFEEFTSYLSSEFGIRQSKNSHSYLRLFYLLEEAEIANNYHKDFLDDFDEPLLDKYAKVWNLHTHFVGDKEEKRELKAFYKETIFSSIHTYINRNVTCSNRFTQPVKG